MTGPGARIQQSGQRRGNMVFNAVNKTSTHGELPIKKPPTLAERKLEAEIQEETQAAKAAGYMRLAAGSANKMKMKAAARARAAERRTVAAVPSVSLQPTAVTSQNRGGLTRGFAIKGSRQSPSALRAGMYLPPPPVASDA